MNLLKYLPDNPRIIISRTDNIGDVILSFPLAFLLKQQFPNCHITYLAQRYTESIVAICPDVDDFIAWDDFSGEPYAADVILHAFGRHEVAKWAKQSKIPYRIGSSHRWYNLINCNIRLPFSRRRSDQHEAQLNLKLLEPFGISDKILVDDLASMIRLQTSSELDPALKKYLDPTKFNLILHPGTNGHTREWAPARFVELAKSLPTDKFNVILTGSDAEAKRFQYSISQHLPQVQNTMGLFNLKQFVELISAVDGLMAPATGPLHIAAAFDHVHALGLYPARQGIDIGRWGPVGKNSQYLVTDKTCPGCDDDVSCACMKAISVAQVRQCLLQWQRLTKPNT